MRKVLLFAGLALALGASGARAGVGVGVELYAGLSEPALQDDRGHGTTYGIRAPVNLVPLLAIEPYYSSSSYDDKTFDTLAGTQTLDGGKVTSYGVNLLLLTGSPAFKFYPFGGLGSNTDNRDWTGDVTNTGYNFGLGMQFGLPANLGLDIRAEGQMIVTGDTSRKFGNVTAGVTYHFLKLP